jgi:polyisoprenoid-binding protein YceI
MSTLKPTDFLDSENYRTIVFNGTSYLGSHKEGRLTGNLSVRGIAKPSVVGIEFGGIVVNPYGQTKAGFTVEGKSIAGILD